MICVISVRLSTIILSKYNLPSINFSVYGIKQCMWKHFVDVAHDRGQIVFS